MRVIAGRLRGRRVDVPRRLPVRPTYDRVRESVFAIIGPRIEGASVLDLFAGSGVLAIESVSRGARSAVLVEIDPAAIGAIRRNAERLGIARECDARRGDALRLLSRGALPGPFDIVFVDPPYGSGAHGKVLELLGEPGRLPSDALVIVEHAANDELPESCLNLTLTRRERYGSTAVSFYRAPTREPHEREAA